jgi:hypothetical protein
MKLTENFSLEEMTRTDIRPLIDKNAAEGKRYINQLVNLAEIGEIIRAHFNRDGIRRPFIVHSAFRCYEVNKAVGGSDLSQHAVSKDGKFSGAIDFHVSGAKLEDVFTWIYAESNLSFHQLIFEGYDTEKSFVPSWIHIGVPVGYKDGQVFRLAHNTKRKEFLKV